MGNNAKYGMAAWNGRGTRNAYNLQTFFIFSFFPTWGYDVSLVWVAAHGIFVIVSIVFSSKVEGICVYVSEYEAKSLTNLLLPKKANSSIFTIEFPHRKSSIKLPRSWLFNKNVLLTFHHGSWCPIKSLLWNVHNKFQTAPNKKTIKRKTKRRAQQLQQQHKWSRTNEWQSRNSERRE